MTTAATATSIPSPASTRTTADTRTTARPTTTTTQLASIKPPRFSLTFEQEGVTRDFLKVSKLVLRGGTGHKVQTYDVGTNVPDISFVRGASDPRQSDDRTWRSFDSPTTIALTDAQTLYTYSGFDIECRPRTVETPLEITSHGRLQDTQTVTLDEWQTLHFTLL